MTACISRSGNPTISFLVVAGDRHEFWLSDFSEEMIALPGVVTGNRADMCQYAMKDQETGNFKDYWELGAMPRETRGTRGLTEMVGGQGGLGGNRPPLAPPPGPRPLRTFGSLGPLGLQAGPKIAFRGPQKPPRLP